MHFYMHTLSMACKQMHNTAHGVRNAQQARKLRDVKYELDSRVSELSHRLGSVEGANRSLEEETGRLKQSNTALSAEKHAGDIALNEARARLGALEEKARAQGEVIEQQRLRR